MVLSDNEIIKALECCNSIEQGYFGDIRKCDACPLVDEADCLNQVKILALDLINRQKAEIENLKTHNAVLKMANELCKGWEKRAKVEAVKEYAEMLKDYGRNTLLTNRIIDNFLKAYLKEMVGDT